MTVGTELTENTNFDSIINDFTLKKIRKETLKLDMHSFIINRKIVGIWQTLIKLNTNFVFLNYFIYRQTNLSTSITLKLYVCLS